MKPNNAAAAMAQHVEVESAYGAPFWLTYGSNLGLMVAICLLYRYADLVRHLGGDEFILGWIVGVGMVGSLLTRGLQGTAIDRLGCRRVWLWSIAGIAVACLGHLTLSRCDTPPIFVLRVLYQSSVSGFFVASITFVSLLAPPSRMAEMVGTLGTSGFLGMVLGPALGDWLIGPGQATAGQLRAMFLIAVALCAIAAFCGWLATRDERLPPAKRRPAMAGLILRYRPHASLLAIAAVTGAGLGLPGVFLRTFTAELGIGGMASYFLVYAVTAFIARMSIRRMTERIGPKPMIVLGMAAMVASVVAYLPVRAAWQLAPAAMLLGIAHAVLFPAVMAGGSLTFPERYRGLATTLMLACLDVGSVIGSPLSGGVLRWAQHRGWPRYPTLFVVLAALFTAISVWYALSEQRPPRRRHTQLSHERAAR